MVRKVLGAALCAGVALSFAASSAIRAQGQAYDLIIRNGHIVDRREFFWEDRLEWNPPEFFEP